MMRQLLILLAVMSVALAAVSREPLAEKPEEYKDCEGCWIKEVGQFIGIGETVPSPTGCLGYYCAENEVQIFSCDTVAVVAPCVITEDLSLPYPDCCKQIVCPKNE